MSRPPIIFGAGLAGLIAARMLADQHPIVMEQQRQLPNNHHALLRFRSEEVARATNTTFQKVRVIKTVEGWGDPVKDAIAYSLKVTGKLKARSILDCQPVERYIAPPDLISRLASTADIRYGTDFEQWSANLLRPHGPIISTMPMPYMMDKFKWADKPAFGKQRGWTLKAEIDPALEPSLSCTIYDVRKPVPYYRASITNGTLMFEGTGESPYMKNGDESETLELARIWAKQAFGLDVDAIVSASQHVSSYQKIVELNGREAESAKRFMMWLSSEHSIYSLGRYATWRPKLLLDDIPDDVRVISRLINGESLYNRSKS